MALSNSFTDGRWTIDLGLLWPCTAVIINQSSVTLLMQRFSVGLVIERSLVRLPAGALSSQLGQLSLPSWGLKM